MSIATNPAEEFNETNYKLPTPVEVEPVAETKAEADGAAPAGEPTGVGVMLDVSPDGKTMYLKFNRRVNVIAMETNQFVAFLQHLLGGVCEAMNRAKFGDTEVPRILLPNVPDDLPIR